MFDYQAGEKYKLTLTMVSFAGLMAGTLFTLVLMPQPDSHPHRPRHGVNWSTTAQAAGAGSHPGRSVHSSQPQTATPDPTVTMVSAAEAQNLVQGWLPLAWDLSARSARGSQEQAIMYMTPDCAAAYKQNVWTPDVAKTIQDAGLQSTLTLEKITPGQPQSDGSIVIFVEGTQVMSVPGKGTQQRPKRLEYLIKSTQEGLRVAGISESGQQS
jgi:hypothetical protein